MKILLVGNYLPDKQESMQRFAEVLRQDLKARGHSVQLLRPPLRLNRSGAEPNGIAKWLGYVDKFVLFPLTLRRAARRFDIVHICDHSNAPYLRVLLPDSHLLTCNDVLAIRSALGQVPENPTRWSGKILQRYIQSGLNRAKRVACISQKTKDQLLSVTTIAPDDVCVVYMGQNYSYAPMAQEAARTQVKSLIESHTGGIVPKSFDNGFVLHVGGNQWYKNREGVLRTYALLCREKSPEAAPLLIMAGKKLTDEMEELVTRSGLQDRVLNLQDVTNEDLRALYSCAELLLFPSLAEGFGWPIAEAQACGCRVVTTNDSPMTEVGGDAARYCDPHDEKNVMQCVSAMLNEDASARALRVKSGLKNVERFSTQTMVESYLGLYTEIIAKRRHKSRKA